MAPSSRLLKGATMQSIKCCSCFSLQTSHCVVQQFQNSRPDSYRFLSILYKLRKNTDPTKVERPTIRSYQSSRSRSVSQGVSRGQDHDNLSYSYLKNCRKSNCFSSGDYLSKLIVRSLSVSSKCATSSHDNDPEHQSTGTRSSGTKGTDGGEKKDKSILDNDPELKSIIEDIKRDFANEKPKNKTPETPSSHEKQSCESSILASEIDDNSRLEFTAEDQFEYDYSVAEDIEEYDYIDESESVQHQIQPEKDIPISLERGNSGVFELDELLLLLDRLGAENIVSFPVPPEAKFCDHMVVVSAKSRRHLQAINEEMLYIHKRKKSQSDNHLVVEGLNKSDWCAMDLGNIVLHVFYGKLREYYNIESLWILGPDKDPKCQEADQDPYALSAEDLFWLQAAKSKETSGSEQTDQELSSSGHVSDSHAGWGSSPRQSRH
ncbi:hypothetical protein EGW08_015389 [Elysia chlorotica]|uniref:Mitochondrial assembly of ribosomal large subunit protein 1 n=1 Tax=Elysia chlorotica TaxID=188477 RepID=A0A433T5S0_ELYCH|nr:hypothetical protein EGW08_015389 [Elysia chlorotica]